MRRRDFIRLLGGAAAAWPVAARAQQAGMPVIGFLVAASPGMLANRLDAFRRGLGETGYVEGRNVTIEYRWADSIDRVPAMAVDLVRRQVSVIAAIGTAAAAKAATTTIPIVFVMAGDPVAFGLVNSLNRPGGNITGATSMSVETGPKQLEVLHELVPEATSVGVLVNPTNANAEPLTQELRAAAGTLGLKLQVLNASSERDLDTVFASLAARRVGALVIGPDTLFITRVGQLAALTMRHAVPAINANREFVAAGGLMSYGGSSTEGWHLAGVWTGRVLKGEKPGDLPVQQVTKIELIINLRTAKALGLSVPLALLARADELLE
jgi:putative ABC transport system substrate-binding protein